jgi:hypothetical protein
VEFKKRLGKAEEEKAAKQVRRRLRDINEEYTEEEIERSYEKLCQHMYMKGLKQNKSFKRRFRKVHNRELKTVKYDRIPSTYIVADYATRQAQEAIRRKSKRRKKEFSYMTIQFLRKEKSTSIYSVLKLG